MIFGRRRFQRVDAEAGGELQVERAIYVRIEHVDIRAGIHDAVSELQSAGVDPNYLLFFMYTEAIKHVAENAKAGHTIFVDSNPSRPRELMTEMAAFYRVDGSQKVTGQPPPA